MDTQRNAEFLEEIKKRLNPDRLYHSLNVADEAKKLAKHYGADEQKAFTAGLLHDILKNTPDSELLQYFERNGIMLTETERASRKTWHAMAGADFLRRELHVTDEDILSAVRWHTTGRAGMTLLDKVLFVADFISADRDYPGVERMREKAYVSLEDAMLEGLQFTINELVENAWPVHEDSIRAYNELVINRKG
ncbi:MAG TPA: bis(5'-nucleosyl)-tetraphosphatase (symmetrical) YqeK [Candidatus Fimenecus excrementavium]|jgi:predicted HD superfamily hydrolase involved in NAD metabolism|nr:bis(5'-nucleosyl)-tetraphosphatase (symmetrical) YqeK [Candidatus Fimenecus excrementavium]